MDKYLTLSLLEYINKFITKDGCFIRFYILIPILIYEKTRRMDIIKYVRK